jgi:hypothetical protein
VRTQDEFESGRAPGALLCDWKGGAPGFAQSAVKVLRDAAGGFTPKRVLVSASPYTNINTPTVHEKGSEGKGVSPILRNFETARNRIFF